MLIVDRFEGDTAIIEFSSGKTSKIMEVPAAALPDEAGEGDLIKIIIDDDATRNRKVRIDRLADELFE